MSRKQSTEKGEAGYDREEYSKSYSPQADEGCNAYYTRKVRTKDSELAPDTYADLVEKDDSFAESRNYPDVDKGPLNTPWAKDRYGRG